MEKKVVAFVPIKLNSQRLPHKNILTLGEHALSWYIFNTLLDIDGINDVYVYCSDKAIMNYIPDGVTFVKRNPYLDGDLVKGNQIYDSFIKNVDSDIYILAHTTSPFIKKTSIENAMIRILNDNYDSALSVQKKQTFIWFKGDSLNYNKNDIPRTQDIEPIYIETSGFYMFNKNHYLEYGSRVGFNPYFQELDDIEAIDIDTQEDYKFALEIMKSRKRTVKI